MFTRAHDYAHAHAIVDMHLKLFTRVCRSTREQTHAHRHACPRAHIYAHTHMHALPPFPINMLSLVMSHVRICLQVTINPFPAEYRSTQKPGK